MCVSDLIGTPYEYGARGNGSIDCIHLVLAVLDELRIPRPTTSAAWYQASWRQIARELLHWGERVRAAKLDGDVVLLSNTQHTFGVIWQQGVIHISQPRQAVAWCPIEIMPMQYIVRHYSRTSAI